MKKIQHYLIFATLSTGSVFAEAPQEKHEGFYANVMVGGGLGGYSATYSTLSETGSGGAFQYGGKLGFALSPNFILFGAIDGWSASVSSVKQSIGSASGTVSTPGYSYSVFMFGGGAAFYTDSNFFIAGTVGVAKATGTQSSISYNTDSGIGANLNIGTEWWVAKDFSVGIALIGHYSSMKLTPSGTSVSLSYTNYYVGVAASATYN